MSSSNGGRWPIMAGAAAIVVAVAGLILAGEDRGFWIGVTIILSLICGLGLGAVWAVASLVTGARQPGERRSRRPAVIVLAVAVVVLGGMAAASFNSYRKSQPPAGDHSAEHATAESRALWDAAAAGDLATVTAMIDACADPFVQFDDLGRARSQTGDREIVSRLRAAEDTWVLRCRPAVPSTLTSGP